MTEEPQWKRVAGMTVEEHELLVASVPPKGYSGGQMILCDVCGRYFKTTDWPPAVCRDCRGGA